MKEEKKKENQERNDWLNPQTLWIVRWTIAKTSNWVSSAPNLMGRAGGHDDTLVSRCHCKLEACVQQSLLLSPLQLLQ